MIVGEQRHAQRGWGLQSHKIQIKKILWTRWCQTFFVIYLSFEMRP
jgi:hypothetical protein